MRLFLPFFIALAACTGEDSGRLHYTNGDADTDSLTLPSLHAELELLVQLGGLTPAEALASGTRQAAAVLGAQESRGTIEVGKLADLVVLSEDPLADIRNTRTIQLVVKRGRAYQGNNLRR